MKTKEVSGSDVKPPEQAEAAQAPRSAYGQPGLAHRESGGQACWLRRLDHRARLTLLAARAARVPAAHIDPSPDSAPGCQAWLSQIPLRLWRPAPQEGAALHARCLRHALRLTVPPI